MKDRNENRLGYKKTIVGWIPKDWQSGKVLDIANVIMGQSPQGSSYNKDKCGVPLINGPTEFNIRHPERKQWTTKPTKICKSGDILLCVRGTIGRMNIADDNYCIGRGIAAISEKESTGCSSFIEHTLSYITGKILKLSCGSTFPNIDKKTLSNISVAIPPLPEQKRIAEILSAWDEAIEQTHKLTEAKERQKKALMQQFLTGSQKLKNGISDEWRVRPLGELVEPISRPEPKPKEPYLSIGIRSHGKGTFQKIVESPEKVFMDTLYRVESRDLVVNITFAWEGAIAIAKEQDTGGLVSHRFPTYRLKEKEVNIHFLRNLIQTKRFVQDLGLISPGGAGRNRVLNQKDFLNLRVLVPSMETQMQVAKIFTATHNEIHLLESYLDALKRQKSGLIQKLLTGEVRVKT